MLDIFKPFIIAFLIGLIIGIERENSHPEGAQTSGVRTFILLSLLGCLAAYLHQPSLDIVISIFVFGLIAVGYFRSTAKNIGIGLTTEFSAGVVYCLGYIAFQQEFLASVIAVFVLFVLIARTRLHTFSRQQLKPIEIQAASILLVIGLGILPFLPNRVIDPWHLFNPRLFGLLFLVIATLQFGGYVAIRLVGERLGLVFTGFFGGLVSSTAVFATLPKLVREHPLLLRPAMASCLLAAVASFFQFLIIAFFISTTLFEVICWPVMAMMGVGGLISLFLMREKSPQQILPETLNPLDLKSTVKLSVILALMIFLVGLTKQYLGANAFLLVTFLGGLFQLHTIVFATASLFASQKVILIEALNALALAVVASYLSKIVLLWIIARNRFAILTSVFLIIMCLVGGLVYFMV